MTTVRSSKWKRALLTDDQGGSTTFWPSTPLIYWGTWLAVETGLVRGSHAEKKLSDQNVHRLTKKCDLKLFHYQRCKRFFAVHCFSMRPPAAGRKGEKKSTTYIHQAVLDSQKKALSSVCSQMIPIARAPCFLLHPSPFSCSIFLLFFFLSSLTLSRHLRHEMALSFFFFASLLLATAMAQTFSGTVFATQSSICQKPGTTDFYFNFPFSDEPNPTNCISREAASSSTNARSAIFTFNNDNTVSVQSFDGGVCAGVADNLSGNTFPNDNSACVLAGNAAPLANTFYVQASWTEMLISE